MRHGTRYLGDANPYRKKHFHDTANEHPSCALHGVEGASNAVPIATRQEALAAGFAPCVFCMPYEKGAD